MLTLTSATIYHDVSTRNGLITIKLDAVKIRVGYERLIHKINLEDIRDNINYIEKLATTLNVTDHLEQTLHFKLKKAHEKLNGFYPKRLKRGLVNVLGKAIKFIAGNPDEDDLYLINQNLEILENNSNKIIANQEKQVKINNLLQSTINKVSKTLKAIKVQINSNDTLFRKDLEFINLIFNLDILIKTLEDLEEQIAFSKSNLLNKNILNFQEREYIYKVLTNQHLQIKFEEEIYKFVKSIASLQNNHIIIIVKIPVVEPKEYTLLQLEPVNINGSRINTNIRYVTKHQQTFYEQKERCLICENTYPVNDECIFNILINRKAKCYTTKQPDQPIIKEINSGTILINSHTAVNVLDSCGDSRIISTPVIIETGNCTVTVQNFTFSNTFKTMKQYEYLTPIFGKEIELTKQSLNIEDIHQMNIDNLEAIQNLKLRMTSSQTIGGTVIASIVLLPLIIFCIHRYKPNPTQHFPAEKEDMVTLKITNHKLNPLEEEPEDTKTKDKADETNFSTKALFPIPGLAPLKKYRKPNEDV